MSTRIETESRVTIYEVSGEEVHGLEHPAVRVKSHWNRKEFVVLKVGKEEVTVVESDLRAALDAVTRQP